MTPPPTPENTTDPLALAALAAVDFDWVAPLESVWREPLADVASQNGVLRSELLGRLKRMQQAPTTASPLGWVLVGGAGAGKTHLLSAVRREAQANQLGFVLADLTDIHDFWSTLVLGFLDALGRPAMPGGPTLAEQLVEHLLTAECADLDLDVAAFREQRPPRLINHMDQLVRALGKRHPREVVKHQDVLRALLLMVSAEFELLHLGHGWLQGHGLGEEELLKFGFDLPRKVPHEVVRGLSWLMSLRAPTLLALDQLDAIVAEQRSAEREPALASQSIIEGLGRGLLELRDVVQRTLVVVSCIEATWSRLSQVALKSATDRYEAPRVLHPIARAEVAAQLVTERLRAGYAGVGFVPPYPSWPYPAPRFEEAVGLWPRELYKRCENHRRACLERGAIWELATLGDPAAPATVQPATPTAAPDFAAELAALGHDAAPAARGRPDEDTLGVLVRSGCRLLLAEHPAPPEIRSSLDERIVEGDGTHSRFPSLHARLRLLYLADAERERHFSVRVLEETHALAYQARLRAALTASGIDRRLGFRRLLILRSGPVPSGVKSAALTREFEQAGGERIALLPSDFQQLQALETLWQRHGHLPAFTTWLIAHKPASAISALAPIAAWLRSNLTAAGVTASAPSDATPRPAGAALVPAMGAALPPEEAADKRPAADKRAAPTSPSGRGRHRPVRDPEMPLGRQLMGETLAGERRIPLKALAQHVFVFGGPGAGKTALLTRLVEEAALLGVPALLVDPSGVLSRFGEPWPEPPASWTALDIGKAERSRQTAEVISWVAAGPGVTVSQGLPLQLPLLPDFAVVSDSDELELLVTLASEALAERIARGDENAQRRSALLGTLSGALRFFARRGGGSVDELIVLLRNLPAEPGAQVEQEDVALRECIADALAAQLAGSLAAPVRVDTLLGLGEPKTRLSVLDLRSLGEPRARQQLLLELCLGLFSFIKQNPATADRPLAGLLVIDEAWDFIPAASESACKTALLRLAVQGRKYGFGLMLASQSPRIDHTLIAGAATQFYGRVSSPAALELATDQLRRLGGSGGDVARLLPGRFYFHTSGMTAPMKIAVPLPLSHVPAGVPAHAAPPEATRASGPHDDEPSPRPRPRRR